MPRLLRPHIDLRTKCQVALKQMGEMWPDKVIKERATTLSALLSSTLQALAVLLGCEVADLRLDHDPPLGARQKVFDAAGRHVEYIPAANDTNHLFYRPHGSQFDKSHDIKTRVRGDCGQYSDIALIKRERRRERKRAGKERPKANIRSASRWPPKGSRKLNWRERRSPK